MFINNSFILDKQNHRDIKIFDIENYSLTDEELEYRLEYNTKLLQDLKERDFTVKVNDEILSNILIIDAIRDALKGVSLDISIKNIYAVSYINKNIQPALRIIICDIDKSKSITVDGLSTALVLQIYISMINKMDVLEIAKSNILNDIINIEDTLNKYDYFRSLSRYKNTTLQKKAKELTSEENRKYIDDICSIFTEKSLSEIKKDIELKNTEISSRLKQYKYIYPQRHSRLNETVIKIIEILNIDLKNNVADIAEIEQINLNI